VDIDQVPVLVRLEQTRRQTVRARQPARAVNRLDHKLLVGGRDQLRLVRLLRGILGLDQPPDGGDRGCAGVEDLGLGQEGDRLVPELRLHGVGPALVLAEAAVEPLPARRGQLA
jgi:hypothetical protein